VITQRPLRTQRLTIRPFRRKDLSGLYELQSDPEATRFVGGVWTLESTRTVLHTIIANYARKHLEWYAVAERRTGAFVGVCFLTALSPRWCEEIDAKAHVELGYRFVRRHWGQGYATEAAEAMLEWGFRRLELDEIVSIVRPENVASVRVLERLGMQLHQTFYHHAEPIRLHAITRAEFYARSSPAERTAQ
jgi:ribosomal-protein-alanine N-acetyltransferase